MIKCLDMIVSGMTASSVFYKTDMMRSISHEEHIIQNRKWKKSWLRICMSYEYILVNSNAKCNEFISRQTAKKQCGTFQVFLPHTVCETIIPRTNIPHIHLPDQVHKY